ncbi:MAG: imidazole glycerol phosphate synthase subunit HisH, partial [Caulobacteraceae bacterium]|nr:imidazole glycerol phosphate synthase subunit HisH [Caulobacteraceae bacterium]
MQRIALIDYGSGNLRSAEKALIEAARLRGLDAQVLVTHEPEVVASADRLMLPGVGAFGACMAHVQENDGLVEAMTEAVLKRGAPFLGVCVGMQLLATRGLEFGETAGLGWIAGDVARLTPVSEHFKVPHMGWNSLTDIAPHPLFAGLGAAPEMYFTHSFAFQPSDKSHTAAMADHGGAFAAAVARDNVLGVQFHPEKSQTAGLELLGNFLEW